MIYDVAVYLSSLQKQNPSRKVDTLMAFAEGATNTGASVIIERQFTYRPAKLAVILGWHSPNTSTRNIRFREELVHYQQKSKNHIMAIDANCFKFTDIDNKYLRYSLNGVYYDTGEYANKNSSPDKWTQISNEFNLSMSPWKSDGEYILVLVQRNGGWGMKGLNPIDWVQETLIKIQSLTDLPIVLRPHPGKIADLSHFKATNVKISDSINTPLLDDLKLAKSAIVFNSSSGVASILSGVPLWCSDSSSVCWEVSNKDLSTFNTPTLFDRTQWIYDLAACHWTDDESSQGLIYQHFLPYIT